MKDQEFMVEKIRSQYTEQHTELDALKALAYPVYNRVLKKQRQKIAPQILHLSEELLK